MNGFSFGSRDVLIILMIIVIAVIVLMIRIILSIIIIIFIIVIVAVVYHCCHKGNINFLFPFHREAYRLLISIYLSTFKPRLLTCGGVFLLWRSGPLGGGLWRERKTV